MTDQTHNADLNEEAIERDVQRTQDAIGETVEKLDEKLSPSAIGRELMGEEGLDAAKEALDVARRNPLPVALIAIGAVWLFATSDSPLIREMRRRLIGGSRPAGRDRTGLRPRSAEPAPIGPPSATGEEYDRAFATSGS